MATAASLTVDLLAKTASFEAGMKRANESLGTLNKSVAGIQGVLKGAQTVLGTFGIALGTVAIAQFAKDAVTTAGNLGELAQQLGVTTDLLQSLQFAAAQNSVSTEQLEAGLAKFTRTVGEAADGTKTALDFFNKLGVGVLNADGHIRNNNTLLLETVGALAKVKDPAARAALEVEGFGRAGQRLDPILSRGVGGIQEMVAAARQAGVVLSTDTIQAADKFGDQIATLTIQAKALAANLAGDLIPWLGSVADKLNAINAAAQASGKSVHDFFANLGAGDTQTKAAMERLRLGDRTRTDAEKGLTPIGPDVTLGSNAGALSNVRGGAYNPPGKSDAESAAKKIQGVIDALKLQRDNLARTAEQQQVYNELAKAGTTINTAAGKTIADLVQQISAQSDALKATNDLEEERISKLKEQDDALAASFKAQKDIADAAAQRQADISQEIKDNEELIAALQQGTHAYELQLEIIRERNAALQSGSAFDPDQAKANAEALTSQAETLDRIRENAAAVQAGMEAVGSEFIDAATGVQTWADAAKAALGDVLKLILKLVEQQAILAFGGSIGGASGASGGGADIFGWIFKGIGSVLGFAEGGRPPTDRPSVIGEHGPEWFWPDSAGTVLPNNFSAAASGAGGPQVVNNYDFRGSSVDRAYVQQQADKIARKQVEGLLRSIDSGGPPSKITGRRKR